MAATADSVNIGLPLTGSAAITLPSGEIVRWITTWPCSFCLLASRGYTGFTIWTSTNLVESGGTTDCPVVASGAFPSALLLGLSDCAKAGAHNKKLRRTALAFIRNRLQACSIDIKRIAKNKVAALD